MAHGKMLPRFCSGKQMFAPLTGHGDRAVFRVCRRNSGACAGIAG